MSKSKSTKGSTATQPISGFPEWLPEVKILENRIMGIIRSNYELFGFVPIETPAVERNETLTSKGGNEKEIYSLSRLTAREGEDDNTNLALHFDLTVPLARYVAQHYGNLAFPFRRYQMQKVWRGERAQAGRFREFYQCDIDVIGDGELSFLTDAEIPSIIHKIFTEMNIGRFVIRINNRKILQGLFQGYGIFDDQIVEVLRSIDKLEKIGVEAVCKEVIETTSLSEEKVGELIDIISQDKGNESILSLLKSMDGNELFKLGVSELSMVYDAVKSLGVPEECLSIDLKIARGLDYYTGTVYETALVDYPGVGSICSGGRYDNLASHFTDKKLPGVGISIGITRLLWKLLDAGIVKPEGATVAPVLVTTMDKSKLPQYLTLASELRAAGIGTEVYLESLSLKAQLKYANRKQFAYAIIAGEEEFAEGVFSVKDMRTGEQQSLTKEAIILMIKKGA